VIRTRVGYAGGEKRYPTYRSLGDHTETIQIDFDPARISYTELLAVFWKSHNPTIRSRSRQYKAAVFYHNDEQKSFALETSDREQKKHNKDIQTEILPFTGFHLAEDYHQKYRLRQESGLMQEYISFYPGKIDFINSTAAARVNGYLGGYGSPEGLEKDIHSLGLSPAAMQILIDILSESRPAFRSCPL
jgi:methionine-S-sulfoxide reductase